MPCIRFGNGIMCYNNIYKYKNYIFEWHNFCGPMKLNKDLEPSKITGRKFYSIVTEWCNLSAEDKKKYLLKEE